VSVTRALPPGPALNGGHLRCCDSMASDQPFRYALHLPPLAQLPRIRNALAEVCDLLTRALAPAKRFERVRDDLDNDLRLAVAVHGLNALDAARAIHVLSGTEYAWALIPHLRTVFETLVKIKWMRAKPQRAREYFLSEPFERYAMATPKVKASSRWAQIVRDCELTIEQNPTLLDLPKVRRGKNETPNYGAVARALRMRSLETLANEVRMDDETYLLDFDVPSLYPHTSVVHTKNFARSLNADGTVVLSTEMEPLMLLGYVARSATRTGEVLQEVLGVFHDGAILFDTEKSVEALNEIVTAINGVIINRGP